MINLSNYLYESVRRPSRIFIIIKPGFLKYSKDIIKRFEEDGWKIERQTTKHLLLKEARKLYAIHKKEDFYKPLCEYMSSDITTAFIMKKDDEEMSKNVFDEVGKIKDEIREKYGESDMRNVMHSSDSLSHMHDEASIYFGNFAI